jgi:F-type H+-transporting ATPase subunit b
MARWFALLAAALLLVAAPALAAPPAQGTDVDPHAAPGAGESHADVHPGPGPINWFYGMIGEKEGLKEGNLLFRPKGMPAPFGAWVINTAILFFFVGKYASRPVSDALKKRKASIMHGIDEAAQMKEDAAARLAGYEDKLAHVDDEIERVKREMIRTGEVERERILAEAREKRTRVERDAKILIEQELKEARELLLRETIAGAVRSAAEALGKQVTDADHERLAQEYLAALDRVDISARGGRA